MFDTYFCSHGIFKSGNTQVAQIKSTPDAGNRCLVLLYWLYLVCSGVDCCRTKQYYTGTLAGQIVMKDTCDYGLILGASLLTRLLAIIPALLVIQSFGEDKLDSLVGFFK